MGHACRTIVVTITGEREDAQRITHGKMVLRRILHPTGGSGSISTEEISVAFQGRNTVSGRARVVDGLLGILPQLIVGGKQPVTILGVTQEGRILNGLLQGNLGFIGLAATFRGGQLYASDQCIAGAIDSLRAHERVFTAPLVSKTERFHGGFCASRSGHQGTQVTVHHLRRENAIVKIGDFGSRYPDVPAPEDLVVGILDGNEGITGLQGLGSGEDDVVVGIGNLGNDAVGGHFLGIVVGLPHNLGLSHFTNALIAVTLHGPEHVVARFFYNIAVGGAFLTQVLDTFFSLILSNDDGLDNVVAALLGELHRTGTEGTGGIVIQREGDLIDLGLHTGHVNPFVQRRHIEFHVGNYVGDNNAILAVGDVVDIFANRLVHHFYNFGLDGDVHHGSKANLGVGIDQENAGGICGERSNYNLVLFYRHGEHPGVVTGHTYHGACGLGAHGVGNLDGFKLAEHNLGGIDVQLKGLGKRDIHHGIVGEGEDNLVLLYLDVGEDTIHQGGATGGHGTQVHGILTVDGDPEVTIVVDGEDRGLVNGDILVVHHDGNAVDGPYQLTGAILDHTQHGTVIILLGSDFKVLDVAVGIGDGNADGLAGVGVCILLHLSHEYALANGRLESLDTGFQRGDTGVQTADQLSEPRIVILLGATYQKQRHGNTC